MNVNVETCYRTCFSGSRCRWMWMLRWFCCMFFFVFRRGEHRHVFDVDEQVWWNMIRARNWHVLGLKTVQHQVQDNLRCLMTMASWKIHHLVEQCSHWDFHSWGISHCLVWGHRRVFTIFAAYPNPIFWLPLFTRWYGGFHKWGHPTWMVYNGKYH